MFALIRPFLPYVLAALAALVGVGGVYWYIHHQGVLAEQQRQREAEIRAYLAAVQHSSTVATELEAKLADLRKTNAKLQEELQHETNRDPVYRECRLPIDGVRILQRAFAGTTAR